MIPWDAFQTSRSFPLQYMEFAFADQHIAPLIVPRSSVRVLHLSLMRRSCSARPRNTRRLRARRLQRPADSVKVYSRPSCVPRLILVGVLNMITVWNDYSTASYLPAGPQQQYRWRVGLGSFKGAHQTRSTQMLLHHRGDDHPACGCVPFRPEAHISLKVPQVPLAILAGGAKGWLEPLLLGHPVVA